MFREILEPRLLLSASKSKQTVERLSFCSIPGANCSAFGCSASRSASGISVFGLPKGKDEYSKTWRDKLIHIITKDRVIDPAMNA